MMHSAERDAVSDPRLSKREQIQMTCMVQLSSQQIRLGQLQHRECQAQGEANEVSTVNVETGRLARQDMRILSALQSRSRRPPRRF